MAKMTRYLVAVLVLFLAGPGMAEGLSYNFVQASYHSVEIDLGFDVDGDGFGLGGSFEIGEDVFGFASYGKTDFDFDIDLTQLHVGLGYRIGLSDNTEFFATASYVDVEVGIEGFGSVDESGYGLGIGVRSNVSDLVEVYAEIAYVDLGDGGDGTALGGGIWFNLNESFALGLGAAVDDDVTSYGASARFYFGR